MASVGVAFLASAQGQSGALMIISNATIDCYLYANGHDAGGVGDNSYLDYQHHHWDIGGTNPIDHTIQNVDYTWTVEGNGYDSSGSWGASASSLTSQAQCLINSSNMVIFSQTHGYGVNKITEQGSNANETHDLPELIWPSLTWGSGLITPTSITFRDGKPPSTRTWVIFVRGKVEREVMHIPGIGGEDYTTQTQYFQKPAVVRATAWWRWTINLN
jgi:hypothetical protein